MTMQRRDVVRAAAATVLGAAGATVLATRTFAQQPASQLAEAIAEFTGGKPVQRGRVKIDIAPLVDNGNTVPLGVTVESPMSATDRVESLAIFNDKNPQRDVARFTFGPRAARATVATRIRLATSQKLSAIAKMSDGSYWSDTVDVVVVLAACIEGESS